MGARAWSRVLFLMLVVSCGPRSSAETQDDRKPTTIEVAPMLAATGNASRLHFSVELVPAAPRVGEIFQVVTSVREAASGAPVEGAHFELDATMPQHQHGMMTRPEHRELGEGRYLSEGFKLHMPGRWEITARASTDEIADDVVLIYHQPVAGT